MSDITSKRKYSILVGNDINSVSDSDKKTDWKSLLDSISAHFEINFDDSNSDELPYTLLFEKILSRTRCEEHELRTYICNYFSNLKKNSIHDLIPLINANNILTTNYDYRIESAFNFSPPGGLKSFFKDNLFKSYPVNDQSNIWHIHGEVLCQKSITIGFNEYIENAYELYSYKMNSEYDFVNRLWEQSEDIYSWFDLFFLTDLYILGFNLRIEELTLWWLISHRSKQKRAGIPNIPNKITYFYPSEYNNAAVNLLNDLNIITVPVENHKTDKDSYYKYIVKYILKEQNGA